MKLLSIIYKVDICYITSGNNPYIKIKDTLIIHGKLSDNCKRSKSQVHAACHKYIFNKQTNKNEELK